MCPAVEPFQVGLVGTAAGSTGVMSAGTDPGNMDGVRCMFAFWRIFVSRDSARCVVMCAPWQCAEECLTYEAEDRSTVDEIAEWLDEIVEDVRGSHSEFESLLEDIIPVKKAPSYEKATFRTRPRSRSNDADSYALLESIRAYKKQSGGGKGSPRVARPRKKRAFGAQARGKSPRPDADKTVARWQKTENSVPSSPRVAPKFAHQYVTQA